MENEDIAWIQTLENLTTEFESFAKWKENQFYDPNDPSPASVDKIKDLKDEKVMLQGMMTEHIETYEAGLAR